MERRFREQVNFAERLARNVQVEWSSEPQREMVNRPLSKIAQTGCSRYRARVYTSDGRTR